MKLIGLVICSLLFALASADSNIDLDVFSGSNKFWLAVAVRNGAVDTATVQMKESGSSNCDSLTYVSGWGYWTSGSLKELSFPVSLRLTSSDGRQLTLPSIVSSAKAGVVNAGVNYVDGNSPSTGTPTAEPCPSTPKPTETPSEPTSAPTSQPTSSPTSSPTSAPTSSPTRAPTSAPTRAPTSAPTSSPTRAPTSAPTRAPTSAPTSAPTRAPTSAPTRAPTSAPTSAPTRAPTSAPTSSGGSGCSGPIKLMVPLYSYPGSTWDTVAASGSVVPTVAIINPSSGPGSGPDSAFKNYMPKLKNAGVDMVGYVHTSYGSRSLSTVKAEIDIYASQFPLVVGIFLDEVSADDSKLSYYQELHRYIMAMPGWKYNIINPGTTPTSGYANAATQIVSYESSASGFASSRDPSYATCAKKDQFAMITYGGSSSQMQSAISAAKTKGYYGWVYVTSTGATGGTYNSLPSYYADMARYIASLN